VIAVTIVRRRSHLERFVSAGKRRSFNLQATPAAGFSAGRWRLHAPECPMEPLCTAPNVTVTTERREFHVTVSTSGSAWLHNGSTNDSFEAGWLYGRGNLR